LSVFIVPCACCRVKSKAQRDAGRVANNQRRVALAIYEGKVPRALLFNADETGIVVGAKPSTTIELVGSKDVSVNGYGNKAQVTALQCVSADGDLLKAQLIYPGKTSAVHPTFGAPLEYVEHDHSSSHWSTGDTLTRWIDTILMPHVRRKRLELKLPNNQVALLLFDAYKAHFMPSILVKLAKEFIRVIPIEPGYTSELQPCDQPCGINRMLKPALYSAVDHLLTSKICRQLGIDMAADNTEDAFIDVEVDVGAGEAEGNKTAMCD